MVFLETSQEWQLQTSLLLQARPTTARITVKHNIPNLGSNKYKKALAKRKQIGSGEADKAATPLIPRATFCLKTYDPESGVCLKFKTDRAAEVGRLINGMGKLGRHMAALPQETEDTVVENAPTTEQPEAPPQPVTSGTASTSEPSKAPQPGSGGGKNKKKKGKK